MEFTEQALVFGKFAVDVVIDRLPVVVQWDGDYWHGFRAANDNRPVEPRVAKRMALDKSQDAYMRRAGVTVVRAWEHEVYRSPELVAERVMRAVADCMDVGPVQRLRTQEAAES